MNILSLIRFVYVAFVFILGTSIGEGSTFGIENFLIPAMLMGLGVAIDVSLATLAKFKDDNLTWQNWTFPVTMTHILFPAFGYFLFWFLDGFIPSAHLWLGLVGFIFVFLFVYEVLSHMLGKEPIFGISAWISNIFGFSSTDARTYVAVLAVSWDALWSGPALAAQASSGSWSLTEVVLSFVIAGVVVALIAETSLAIAKFFNKRTSSTGRRLVPLTILGSYLELSVIGGFGVLSLWHGLFDSANLYLSILLAATALIVVFIPNLKTMKNNVSNT